MFLARSIYWTPDPVMVGFFGYFGLPLLDPVASRALTTFRDWASATSPKTTCLPSSQLVTTVVMKNWEPLLNEHVRTVRVESIHVY